nr:putative RNA-directed DNA polymerase, eukaryota, reverse transcriptase zinc-binding domain protein [Tanacetum cinerariifolium]
MSKLDRFLVSEGLLAVFPCMSVICLDRHLSDHRPILLRDVIADYGAIPFRMFHSWMEWEGFDLMVSSVWNSIVLNDRNGMVRFNKKLQILKREIRSWVAAKKHERRGILNNVKSKLNAIDTILDQGGVNDELLLSRMELVKQQHDLISSDARDRFQKAKGVMVEGEWVDDPMRVKDEFLAYFSSRFRESGLSQTSINFKFPNRLSLDQVEDIEKPVSRDEIHEAVEWFFSHNKFTRGCNSLFITLIPKIHDPKFVSDYRTISLIGSLYKVVTKILARRLSSVLASLISDVQTAFLPNRQILDGPFIIDELLSWCKRVKQQAMIFKVDFAKAYDFIRWEYLDNVLDAFGFWFKWRAWIKGSLLHGMAFSLVNGSPTSEFELHHGLKQGDPLAPYLFILVIESLHLTFARASDVGFFKGITVNRSFTISHLFYADDAVFIGEWSNDNLRSILQMLTCFSMASGLSINLQKSQLLGVGVHGDVVSDAVAFLGCSILKTPFKYLGVTVGGNMSKISAWEDSINKLKARKIVWIQWSKVLASKKLGGLGVSSFYALNRALFFKWVWRFLSRN